jgi:predicted CXXCH cytochrome family protein
MRRLYFVVSGTLACAVLSLHSMPGSDKPEYRTGSFTKYTNIAGAARVGSEACKTCHAEEAGNFAHAFHAQQGVECEDCHGPGSLHIDGGGDVTKIISFRTRTADQANGVCLSCHAQGEKVRHWLSGSHAANHVRCADCHQVHVRALRVGYESRMGFDTATRGAFVASSVSPETDLILRPRSASNDACLKCHQTQVAQLSMPYHHPLREGKMSCDDCHDPHGGPAGNNLRAANVNELCLSCHAQYRGPFAYQHPPVTENCMNCHTAHGSPNIKLLNVSEPALCLQCHAGHHNGASLPLADRCTSCHGSIHGSDVPTPSGGSRFLDKGCSEVSLRQNGGCPPSVPMPAAAHSRISAMGLSPVPSHVPTYGLGPLSGAPGMLSSGTLGGSPGGPLGAFSGVNMWSGASEADPTEAAPGNAYYSFTPGAYRFVDGSGYLGRVGEYDSLQESAGGDAVVVHVLPQNHLTVVSHANVLSGLDFSTSSQLTVGERLQAGFNERSFVQQQDNEPFYAFPVLDVPSTPPAINNCLPSADCTTQLIPSHTVFGVTRRLGDAYARFKVPKVPVHLFVRGDWQARSGQTQLAYLDENSYVPIPGFTQFCGAQCHFQSGGSLNAAFQQVNYTTRNIAGGADVDLGQMRLTYEHGFSSFNDRLPFPTGVFTGTFHPADDSFGYSGNSPATTPPAGPTPGPIEPGNYYVDIPAPNQYSSDEVRLTWTASPKLSFNGNVAYTRLRDMYTDYPQNSFASDNTLNWRPLDRLRVTADYHQQNLINDFTPYYSMYGNVSYHNNWERLRLDYELPENLDVEAYYKRNGITRSNANLWRLGPYGVGQIYSVDNTDWLGVVPTSFSNTGGLALRYHDGRYWSARAGYEWTGTHDPGYLIIPQSNNRAFADLWLTLTSRLVFTNDFSIIVQNAFPAVPLPNTSGASPLPAPYSPTFDVNVSGLPPDFERRSRYYTETASANLQLVPEWNLGLGYSYQQNNLDTYMAFQNDSGPNYVLEEPFVPYKQITQAYWGESTYTFKQRLGFNLRLMYNSARSGFRPDLNPNDAAKLGNAFLISQGICESGAPPPCFDPVMFQSALNNLAFSSTQISQVIVPQWIGQSKAYYHFPHGLEGGLIFYYGSYRDQFNPDLNGVLRTISLYVGRSW